MKKSILTICSLIAVALLFTSAAGCLEKSNASSTTPGLTISPGYIDYVTIYEKDGYIIANIYLIIHGTYGQSPDMENITVTVNGNEIEVYLPVITKDGPNTRDLGYKNIEVVLGKSSDFKNGEKYNVGFNGDKNLKYAFMVEDDVLTTFAPATIETIEIKTDGKNVIAVVKTSMSGSQNVDAANIIKSESFQNNEYDIYIPMKTTGSIITLDIKWITDEFVLGELSQFEDGTYTININKQNTTFEIKNSALIDSSQ